MMLSSIRQWLDSLKIEDPTIAQWCVSLIPAQCPFERDIIFLGQKIAHIPPLCKLNPLYEQLASLRFRSLCFLAEYELEQRITPSMGHSV